MNKRDAMLGVLLLLGRDSIEVAQGQVILDQPTILIFHCFSYICKITK